MDSTEALGFLRRRGVKIESRRSAQRWLKAHHIRRIGRGRATLYDGDGVAEALATLGEPMPAEDRKKLGLESDSLSLSAARRVRERVKILSRSLTGSERPRIATAASLLGAPTLPARNRKRGVK